jgi:hypothetical protein
MLFIVSWTSRTGGKWHSPNSEESDDRTGDPGVQANDPDLVVFKVLESFVGVGVSVVLQEFDFFGFEPRIVGAAVTSEIPVVVIFVQPILAGEGFLVRKPILLEIEVGHVPHKYRRRG